MSEGFEVEVEMPRGDIDRLLKRYKKLKKYQKSSLFAVKTMDGTENIISKMIQEVEDDPL
jgi:2-methylcitrate dehydratase PrpD